MSGYREHVAERLVTERLVLRAWHVDDAAAALGAYGHAEVARWLTPARPSVTSDCCCTRRPKLN